jgi:hypothetical protein
MMVEFWLVDAEGQSNARKAMPKYNQLTPTLLCGYFSPRCSFPIHLPTVFGRRPRTWIVQGHARGAAGAAAEFFPNFAPCKKHPHFT